MRKLLIATFLLLTLAVAQQSSSKAGLLTPAELKQLIPQNFFYAGKTASVQARNSAGVRTASGKLVLAALVDNSGYSSNIAEKYQGFLLTDSKVKIGGKDLAPGAYGIGVVGTNFIVQDLGANEIFSTAVKEDAAMKRPTPLKMVTDSDGTELCLGKKCVEITAQ